MLVIVIIAVYLNSLSVPLLFDDHVTIERNLSIRNLRAIGTVLSPPDRVFSGGRPIVNLSFALNYAIGRTDVATYHIVNLLIHVTAALVLAGLVRRTLLRSAISEELKAAAIPFAFVSALLWALHPLQTESVTYVSQRAESLMGLFYLLSVYALVRSVDSPRPGLWQAGCVFVCWLGMATKEVMVTAPVVVLLYDRTFLAGSFRHAWRSRHRMYLGLAASWTLLAVLMSASNVQRRGIGYGNGYTVWSYALTECQVVLRYLRLAVWPSPLVFDYGFDAGVASGWLVPASVILVAVILVIVALAMKHWPRQGFVAGAFLILLAPTSSFISVAGQPMAESRMYLPLAMTSGFALGASWLVGVRRSYKLLFFLVLGFGLCASARNRTYRNEITIWEDTVMKLPESSRAHDNLGAALQRIHGREAEAIAHHVIAVKLAPDNASAHNNLGNDVVQDPARLGEAIDHFEAALRIDPGFAEAHNNLGIALAKVPGRSQDAISQYETALSLNPQFDEAHYNLGNALLRLSGRESEAVAHFESALRLRPDFADACNGLGLALERLAGRRVEAIAQFERAVRLRPTFAEAQNNLGVALLAEPGSEAAALSHAEVAAKLRPDYAEAHNTIGMALLRLPGRRAEAVAQFDMAVRLNPELVEAHYNLAASLMNQPDRRTEARAHLEVALRLRPDLAPARRLLQQLNDVQP